LPCTTALGAGATTASRAPVSALIMCEPLGVALAGTGGFDAPVVVFEEELPDPQPVAMSATPARGTARDSFPVMRFLLDVGCWYVGMARRPRSDLIL
jgi:hypothetical protein